MRTIKSRKPKKTKQLMAGTLILTYVSHMLLVPIVLANPTGLSSSTPGVSFSGVGTSNVTITSTALRSIVNAQTFNLAQTDTTNVAQSSNASMLVRIGDINPSSINGTLNAMGQLILLNPNGIVFGPNAQINVGALIASSLHLTDANFLAGQYLFQGTGIEGVVRNMGAIQGTSGVYLLAPNVENHGVITSPGGNIVLAAGTTAYLSTRPDGNGLLAELQAPAGEALNVGQLIADGGNISMAGLVVNQNGVVQANAVQSRNGKIELIAKQPDSAPATDPLATLAIGAGSLTKADGGLIVVNGQTVTHNGELQANGGTIEVTATAGAQAGSGVLTTGVTSQMTADGGSIRLTGDTVTHGGQLRANVADGKAGSIDLQARGTNATLKMEAGSLIAANGGDVVLEGRAIDQGGTIQANAVGERNGHVTFLGGDQLTFRATSDITVKGDSAGVLDGGTIIGMARNIGGAVAVDPAARFDVSAAPGGQGGELWLGDRRQSLSAIGTGTVIGASQTRLIPTDSTISFLSGSGGPSDVGSQRDVSLVALNDLTVTGFLDLSSLPQAANPSKVRFVAGHDVLFSDVLLLGPSPFSPPTTWDIVALAERSILFTGFAGSLVQTANGGGIALQARTGDVNLVDPTTGALSTVHVQGAGGLSIRTGRDLIAPTGFDENGGTLGLLSVQGISIDGPGALNLDVGRDFLGGKPGGVPSGPGFVLRNTESSVAPQHTVKVGRHIGETTLPLGPDGLPLTDQERWALMSEADRLAKKPLETEKTRGYADFALSGGDLSVTAGGNVYLARVRDAGLVGGKDIQGNLLTPQLLAGFENTNVSIVSRNGNILLNTDLQAAGRASTDAEKLGQYLPASFSALAENGTIQIRSNLVFLPSPTGTISFIARDNIQGVSQSSLKPTEATFFDQVYVGVPGAGGHWVVYDKRTILEHDELWQYLGKQPPPGVQALDDISFQNMLPDYAWTLSDNSAPNVKLSQVNPGDLVGKSLSEAGQLLRDNIPAAAVPAGQGAVTFKTLLGDISKLSMDLISRPFKKDILIDAGRDIANLFARIFVPDLGVTTKTVTEHVALINDAGRLRPITKEDAAIDPAAITVQDFTVQVEVPNVAATIRAGRDIVLSKAAGEAGLEFQGEGTARVMAGRNLDLADGSGLNFILTSSARGGLLDISVGNNLEMTTSRIVSEAGAGISIHGYDQSDTYLVGYDNSNLYPLQLPDGLRAGINLPAVGGRVNVGENTGAAQKFAGERPTGIQVIRGGSVGQRAQDPAVNPDGTVTLGNPQQDPAAVLIRAKGNVEVNQSRIGTFGGGDIRITSLQGLINAGSGSKNDIVNFVIDQPVLDSQGNPVLNQDGTVRTVKVSYPVPGSGIFTFHPDDPASVDPPTFNDPEINALLAEAGRQSVFGRDVSALNARANQLINERKPVFNQTIAKPFIQSLKLGDISLTAERGDIVIPPAGIRGRNVDLYAPHGKVDFQGGAVSGNVNLFTPTIGGSPTISGLSNFGGGATPPPVSPVSGGGAAAAASTTAAASSTSAKSTESVQESAAEQSGQQAEAKARQVASSKSDEKNEKSPLAKSIRVKRGVVIQVDVKPQAQSGS